MRAPRSDTGLMVSGASTASLPCEPGTAPCGGAFANSALASRKGFSLNERATTNHIVIMKQIAQTRLVPVAVIDRSEDALPLAGALREAGVNIIEVTFRTPAAPEAIRLIAENHRDMLVGAGTLLDIYQVEEALRYGARFGVSPGLNESVVLKAREFDLPFMPGVMTPSDVEKGLALGCKLLKFFPAESAGGVKMLRAMAGPYTHTGVKFIPLGGIGAANAATYLREPMVAAIGGSWFVDRKLIQARDWDKIRELTSEAVSIAAEATDS